METQKNDKERLFRVDIASFIAARRTQDDARL
jgi:hypothetical protein